MLGLELINVSKRAPGIWDMINNMILITGCNDKALKNQWNWRERRQAIIWTNAGILLIGTLGSNFSEILSEIHIFSLKKMHLKTSSVKWWPFCLGLNMLRLAFSHQASTWANGNLLFIESL